MKWNIKMDSQKQVKQIVVGHTPVPRNFTAMMQTLIQAEQKNKVNKRG